MLVKFADVKEDLARKDAEIAKLKAQVEVLKEFRDCWVDVESTFRVAYSHFDACCRRYDRLDNKLEQEAK